MTEKFGYLVALVAAGLLSTSVVCAQSEKSQTNPTDGGTFVLAIHGGGGVRPRAEMTEELEAAYRQALHNALRAGYDVLAGGGNSVSAVEAAIRIMEDSPLFNAGKGASYNAEGFHELDASIMNGETLEAGAVAVVQRIRNPISAARKVMESSPHVLLAGDGAFEFAKDQGLEIVAPHYFFTQRKWDSLQRRLRQGTEYGKPANGTGQVSLDPEYGSYGAYDQNDHGLYGTVGAVALDKHGNLAAGTSTGGREGKLPGRVGDSPIIGAGTYAKNATLAVSSTGLGEYVIRIAGTKSMSDLIEYQGIRLDEATNAVQAVIEEMGGSIGVVAIDREGNLSTPYSGDGMYRGHVRQDGKYVVQIYAE